jgi:hypothetical protein
MSAELFKVTCVTCQASLSVRNPALIDQIVACPKCDSMVHVVPPVIVDHAPLTAPVTTTALASDFPSFEEPFGPSTESAAPVPETPEVPVAPSVLEVGNASNATFIMWSVGSFVVGVTLMATFLMLRGGDAPVKKVDLATAQIATPNVATSAANMLVDEPKTEAPLPATSPAPIAEQPSVESATVHQPAAEENPFASVALETPHSEEPALLGPIEQPTDDVVKEIPATKAATPITPPQEKPTEKLVIASADEPRVASKFDPMAIDPEEFHLGGITETAGDEANVDAGHAAGDEQPAEVRPVNAVVPVRLDQESGRASANRVASIQLKHKLPEVIIKDMPLLDFLALVSQLAGVPVSVGPEQLQMAGIAPGRQVTVNKAGATLAEVLESTLGPLHLEVTTEGPQIVIVRQDAAKVRSVNYPVDDLLGDKLTTAAVGKWIEQLIAPETWQSAGGDGTITVLDGSLQVEQPQAVQYQVLFFLERIRLAKGLPLRSKYPAQLLSGKPYNVGVADRLNTPATFTFSHNTPLAEVFSYWQQAAELPIFVDWSALASVGLWPDSRITCTSANEPWQAAFDKILAPLDLAWRAAPGGAVQITSRGRVETEPVVDIYPFGTWRGAAAQAVVIDDAVNGLTYVRAPAVGHRQ